MIAWGYVRVDGAEEREVDGFHGRITEFARTEGYSLKEIFVDRGVLPGDLVRPGFQRMVDDLTAQESTAWVIVPNLDHLSPFPVARLALVAKLASLGVSVVECDPHADTPKVGLSVQAG